jgi:hypothetical protein
MFNTTLDFGAQLAMRKIARKHREMTKEKKEDGDALLVAIVKSTDSVRH